MRQAVESHLSEKVKAIGASSKREISARDYTVEFQERVTARFHVTQSIKQTSRDFSIPARIVNEILHLAPARRPVGRAAHAIPADSFAGNLCSLGRALGTSQAPETVRQFVGRKVA